jgi:Lar family restriction alleviation protein
MSKKREPIKLKPCPFCGGKTLEKGGIDGINGRLRWISCKECGSSSGLKLAVVDAIASWNLRVHEDEE